MIKLVNFKYCTTIIPIILMLCTVTGCGVGHKIKTIDREHITAKVSLGENEKLEDIEKDIVGFSDTITKVSAISNEGGIYMEAEVDSLSGDIIATDRLNEIVVEATFRNVAERNGIVQIVFDIMVPVELQQSQWQVRFTPKFYFLGDSLNLDRVLITGEKFRQAQQRGYSIYNRFADMIVADTLIDQKFVYGNLFKKFVSRHNDMYDKAKEHYRKSLFMKFNKRREDVKDDMFLRFVKDPYQVDAIRLDSVVLDNANGVLKYTYSQNLFARKDLRKVDMVINGEIYRDGEQLCVLNTTRPLTFYISSMVSFVDESPRYMSEVISRNLYLNDDYNIDFQKGKWEIDQLYSNNGAEIAKMRSRIRSVLQDTTYIVDSLVIQAACSPEGSLKMNNMLSGKRANSIKEHINNYLKDYKDSVDAQFWNINLDSTPVLSNDKEIEIKIKKGSEDWEGLHRLICGNGFIKDKESIEKCFKEADLDKREYILKGTRQYKYIREELYPKLRRVSLHFAMHRKGMLKDTIHTVVIDSLYAAGVEALKDRDYKKAIACLKDYKCLNTAIAYVSLDYNNSALAILSNLELSAQRDYLLAVVYGRLGDEKKAVDYYLNSVEMEPSFRHRGNLDPEISVLINKYKLFTNY